MLDDDKRTMGKTAAKEPAAFGRIKQAALDLGMSSEEYILRKDPQANTQQPATDPNREIDDLKESVKDLSKEIQTLRAPPQQAPAATTNNMFDQMNAMATFITSIKSMFPQTSVTDVVAQIGALRTAEKEIYDSHDDIEPEKPEDYALKLLADKLIGGGVLKPNTAPNAAPPTQNIGAGIVPKEITKGVVNVKEDQIKQTIEQIPAFIKAGIKSGEISLHDATAMVMEESKKRNLPVTEEDIKKIYNGVRSEDQPQKEEEKAAQKEEEKAAQKEEEKAAQKEEEKAPEDPNKKENDLPNGRRDPE